MDLTLPTRWCETLWRDEPILNALMISLPVVVGHELRQRLAQVASPRTTIRFRHSSLIDWTKRSACALQLGA